jgi:hypothetical protein
MRCWPLTAEPSASGAWLVGAAALHLAAAAVPWAAGCPATWAVAMSLLALAGLPGTFASIPGRWSRIRVLRLEQGRLTVQLRDGRELEAAMSASSLALRHAVVLRLAWDGGAGSWWLPRAALPAPVFRRLKAVVRLGG